MNKKYFTALELLFFAVGMYPFVPEMQSDAGRFGYFPESAFVLVAMSISRAFAYRNGRSLTVCVLEVAIVMVVFVVQRVALNIVTGHGM